VQNIRQYNNKLLTLRLYGHTTVLGTLRTDASTYGCVVYQDATTTVATWDIGGTLVHHLTSPASLIAYTPGVATNWYGTPVTIQVAIDELAGRQTGIENWTNTAWQNPASATNWGWTSDGTQITLTNYTGPDAVVIPDMLDGQLVTGFGNTFKGGPVTSITGGNNITSIGAQAFAACSSLQSVSLFNVSTVGSEAFQNCASLQAVNFTQNAPVESGSVFEFATQVVNYVWNPTATGWGTNWNERPVVRLPLYGSGSNLADLAVNPGLTGTVALAEAALKAEADTLQTVVNRGGVVTTGVVTIDAGNSQTNTFGGALVIGPRRYQANAGIASGDYSWANFGGTASGFGSWANNGVASGGGSWANNAIASGLYSWASCYGTASGAGSWANCYGIASGTGSWAMGSAGLASVASNNNSFAWGGSHSHGDGTFNIGVPSLFFLGNTNLQTYLDGSNLGGDNATNVTTTVMTNAVNFTSGLQIKGVLIDEIVTVSNDTATIGSMVVSNLEVLAGLTLGGVTKTEWPTGGSGVASGASYTNWLGLSAAVFPSVAVMTNDAMLQNEIIVYMTNSITVGALTNAIDGRKVEYRFTPTNGTYNVTWPTNTFRIPSSSTMSNVVSVVSNTTSFFSVEWNAHTGKWMMQSYVFGYGP
jgi:hypothetical protein